MTDIGRNLGCAGAAAMVTVTFVHPVDTVSKVTSSQLLVGAIIKLPMTGFIPDCAPRSSGQDADAS